MSTSPELGTMKMSMMGTIPMLRNQQMMPHRQHCFAVYSRLLDVELALTNNSRNLSQSDEFTGYSSSLFLTIRFPMSTTKPLLIQYFRHVHPGSNIQTFG